MRRRLALSLLILAGLARCDPIFIPLLPPPLALVCSWVVATLIELPIVSFILRGSYRKISSELVIAIGVANAISLPLLYYLIFFAGFDFQLEVFLAECIAIVAETALFTLTYLFFMKKRAQPLKIAIAIFVANLASFLPNLIVWLI